MFNSCKFDQVEQVHSKKKYNKIRYFNVKP